MHIAIYEDPGWQKLLPLVYVRACCQLLCGTTDLLSRICRIAAENPGATGNGHHTQIDLWCRPILAEALAGQTKLPVNQPLAGPALLLSGRGVWHSLPETDPP